MQAAIFPLDHRFPIGFNRAQFSCRQVMGFQDHFKPLPSLAHSKFHAPPREANGFAALGHGEDVNFDHMLHEANAVIAQALLIRDFMF